MVVVDFHSCFSNYSVLFVISIGVDGYLLRVLCGQELVQLDTPFDYRQWFYSAKWRRRSSMDCDETE